MARPPATNKRDNEKKRQSKRLEKEKRKEERKKSSTKGASLEDMFMYVDANGQLTSTPPDLQNREKVDLESIIISTPKKVEEEENPVHKGRVEHFNAAKGYGFIKELSSINKYFFHISATKENIKDGNIVYFELERGTKDMNAVNIRFEENNTPAAPTTEIEENQD
ncbi:MAG: cold shock domain-containing protein [Tannerellaceae bacterium]|nr:cold shock domain-containing protein [Tannerellaceae bacterium]